MCILKLLIVLSSWSTLEIVQSSSKLSAKTRNFHHLNWNIKRSCLWHGFASSSSTRLILSVPNSWSYRSCRAPSPNSKEKSSKSKLSWNNTTRQSPKTPPCVNELYVHTRRTWGTMALYVLLRLSRKGVLAKLLSKCKKSVLTPINACCQKLIISRSLTCCVHVLLCTLTSKSIICGMPLVFRLTSNVLNACWSGSNGQKNRYTFPPFLITISLNFLIPRSKYVLHNVTQSWGISGCVSWQTTQPNNLYSSMNLQQTSTHPTANMAGHLLESHLMNTGDWSAAKGGQFFLHIPSMVLLHGRLNTDHSRKNYLKISSRKSYYQCATLFQAYVR